MTTSIKFRALTDEDRKLFFEALGEYGKDFQNIQQYMAQRGGQKSNGSTSNSGNNSNSINNNNNGTNNNNNKLIDPQERKESDKKEDDRKREQIRNFYNKLYAKLSELVGKIDDRVEKVNQELYLLINYGEIWKRNGSKINDKTKRLLKELVFHGTTTFRFEKKNVRLRTPTCKALKKINEIGVDEKVKVVTTRELPKDVIVEFHPATNRDWLKIQSMSQNPRVRARLSIQKRLSNVLEYLEKKWSISPEKLDRTVDVWLKTSTSNYQSSDSCNNNNTPTNNSSDVNLSNGQMNQQNGSLLENHIELSHNANHRRIRLKPSGHHELKEVNITRVVPDNHLDLSLNSYIKRLESSQPKISEHTNGKSHQGITCKDPNNHNQPLHHHYLNLQHHQHHMQQDVYVPAENYEFSSVTNASRLPVSLTTPDCSMFNSERSCTSDQPSIAQCKKQLNMLQSCFGVLEGCENSRTVNEDTQDRSLMQQINQNSRIVTFAEHDPQIMDHEPMQSNPTTLVNKDIPALFDEDAALPVLSSAQDAHSREAMINNNINNNNVLPPTILTSSVDCHNSKSVDFQIPKNETLGNYLLKMTGIDVGGDEAANDAFSLSFDKIDEESDVKDTDREDKDEDQSDEVQIKDHGGLSNGQVAKLQNHMIEIEKFAEGWTRQDEPSITIGELYLAFKCPEKIILEYEFEQYTFEQSPKLRAENGGVGMMHSSNNGSSTTRTRVIQEDSSESILMFKLLTAASLSLAHIERRKQEQQHKLQIESQQSCSKLKRRKGSGPNQTMTLHDIEATNQRVEEALKQLQPTRLSSFRRAR